MVDTPKPEFGEMRVAVLDVGQGLAVVIQTKNHALLYDAGPRYSAQSDAGSKIIVPYLRGDGIAKLDGFILSHDDINLSGGATSVLSQVPVNWLASSFGFAEFTPKQKPIECFAGQHWQWDAVNFEVLHPSLESYENSEIKDNNRSCVVKVTSQFASILFAEDVEKEAEKAILETSLQPNIHAASGDALNNGNLLKSDV